jgi:hypothetical protein
MAPMRIMEVGYLIDSVCVVVVVPMVMLSMELMMELMPMVIDFDLYLHLIHPFLLVLSSFSFFS